MKKTLKIILLSVFLLPLLFTSCSTSLEVSKRKHRKGYHVNWVKAPKSSQEQTSSKYDVVEPEAKKITEVDVQDAELQELTKSSTSNDQVTHQEEVNVKEVDTKERNQTAVSEMSRKERRALMKSFRKEVKKLRKKGAHSLDVDDDDVKTILIVVLCFLLPPLAVYLLAGLGDKFWISLILTLLFWIPGIVYAILVYLGEV